MKTAEYLDGVKDTLESLMCGCDKALERAKDLGLEEGDIVIPFKDLKEALVTLLEQSCGGQ